MTTKYIYNPQISIGVYKTIRATRTKTEPIAKYSYLAEVGTSPVAYLVPNFSQKIPLRFFQFLPLWIRQFIVLIEYISFVILFGKEHGFKIGKFTFRANKLATVVVHENIMGNIDASILNALEIFNRRIIRLTHNHFNKIEMKEKLSALPRTIFLVDQDLHGQTVLTPEDFLESQHIVKLPFLILDKYKAAGISHERKYLFCAGGSFHKYDIAKEKKFRDVLANTKNCSLHYSRPELYKLLGNVETDYYFSYFNPIGQHKLDEQKRFFGLDIPKIYKSSIFGIPGEEGNGHLSIGAFEMMLCGTVVITQKPELYTHVGLVENFHFLTFPENFSNLHRLKDILMDLERSRNISEIRNNAYNFSMQEFDGDKYVNVWRELLNEKS